MNHLIDEALDQGFYMAAGGDRNEFEEYREACRTAGAPIVVICACDGAPIVAEYDYLPLAGALAGADEYTDRPGPYTAGVLGAIDDCAYILREEYETIKSRVAFDPQGRVFLIGHPPAAAPALAMALSIRLGRLNRRAAYAQQCGASGAANY